jgi:hypothetical protein
MTTQSHGQIIYYDSDGGPLLCTVTAADVEAMERSREFYRVRVQALHELLEAENDALRAAYAIAAAIMRAQPVGVPRLVQAWREAQQRVDEVTK